MPILKAHVDNNRSSLGFKNHFGSIARCDYCHNYIPGDAYSSPLIDIFLNRHFKDKTILTIGDALFGNWENLWGAPKAWRSFGNSAPNSLFFAADPVAIDSVMADFLEREQRQQGKNGFPDKIRGHPKLAENRGLGLHEKGNIWESWDKAYNRINYSYHLLS
jgi:hypothetical protein